MKKIFCSLLAVFLLTSFVYSLDTDISNQKSYTFKFFNGDINTMKHDKNARDRNGYSKLDIDGGDIEQDIYEYPESGLGRFMWGLSVEALLPITDMVKIGFYGLFNNTWSGSKNQPVAGAETFDATRINDVFLMDVSLAINEKFTMGFKAGGGADYRRLIINKYAIDQVYDIYGLSFFLLSYAFTLKTDMFGNKLNDLQIENTFTFGFGDGWNRDAGYGNLIVNPFPVLQTITTVTPSRLWQYQTRVGSGAYTDKQEFKYVQFRWILDFKENGISIPLKDYVSGLDRFDFVIIPGFQLDTKIWYTATNNAGINFFYNFPVRIYARPNIDFGLKFDGAGFQSSIIFGNDIKVDYETYSMTKDADINTTVLTYKPSLEVKTKKLFTTANIPFIPWIAGGAKWIPKLVYTSVETKANISNPIIDNYNFEGQSVLFNISMGMKFDNLEIEFAWLPTWNYGGVTYNGTDPYQTSSSWSGDTSIWNLANWKFGLTCALDFQKK